MGDTIAKAGARLRRTEDAMATNPSERSAKRVRDEGAASRPLRRSPQGRHVQGTSSRLPRPFRPALRRNAPPTGSGRSMFKLPKNNERPDPLEASQFWGRKHAQQNLTGRR